MSKRGAISDLNDRNWDEEEEPEEAGVFQQASETVLKERVFKKAKRRVVPEENPGKPTFSGFAGFGSKPTLDKPVDVFSSLKPKENESSSGSKPSPSVNGKEDAKGPKDSSYFHYLKSLNESVLAWIKQHVDSNPYIILTPVFKDYENYLKSAQADYEGGHKELNKNENGAAAQKVSATTVAEESKPVFSFAFSSASKSTSAASSIPTLTSKPSETQKSEGTATSASTFIFGQKADAPASTFTFAQKSDTPASTFTFAQKSDAPASTFTFAQKADNNAVPASTFMFGQKPEGNTAASTFTFGSTNSLKTGFSFGGFAKTSQEGNKEGSSQDTENKADDEDYVPPKPEVKEIVEENSLHSIRCKLFHQKEGKWIDRGVGNLHLKPVAEEKTQLLVRADTNLGNIFLNIMLNSSMPVNKQGKNNVVLVCVPNPPIDPNSDSSTPVPMLIKVKTEEDADTLVRKIKERQQLL